MRLLFPLLLAASPTMTGHQVISDYGATKARVTSLEGRATATEAGLAALGGGSACAVRACTGMSASTVPTGATVTATGTCLAATGVTVHGTPAGYQLGAGGTTVMFTVPTGATTGEVLIAMASGVPVSCGTLTVGSGTVTGVSVGDASVAAGGTVQMSATVATSGTPTPDTSVTWAVTSGACTISASGLVTAPAVGGVTCGVRATSVISTSTCGGNTPCSGTATVTVTGGAAAPALSAISATPTASAATITWQTSVAADSRVEWGTTTAYSGTAVTSSSLVTSHSLPLSGLSSSTLYHYRVTSCAGGQCSTSNDYSFTTSGLAGSAYYVSHSGTDATTCGASGTPCRTIAYALNHAKSNAPLGAGDTLYIRGGTSADTNTACASDGAQGGACWVQARLSWDGSLPAGTSSGQLTIACYPGETCILESTTQSTDSRGTVLHFQGNGSTGAQCSYLTFDGLIIDGRRDTTGPSNAIESWNQGGGLAGLCSNVVLRNGKVRHGSVTHCIGGDPYRWEFNNLEVYECGAVDVFDHAYYVGGKENRIVGGRIHHSSQGIQFESVGSAFAPGNGLVQNVEIDHNGANPFNGATSHIDGIYIGNDLGQGLTITGCNVHENTSNSGSSGGYGIGMQYGAVSYVTITNNHVWGNANQNNTGGCGAGIEVVSGATGLVCSGNDTTPPSGGSYPTISSFTATPSSISSGQSSTLAWSVSGATTLSISGLGTVTGSSVSTGTLTVTTTYTLTATNTAGTTTATATVTVGGGGAGIQADAGFPVSYQKTTGDGTAISVTVPGTGGTNRRLVALISLTGGDAQIQSAQVIGYGGWSGANWTCQTQATTGWVWSQICTGWAASALTSGYVMVIGGTTGGYSGSVTILALSGAASTLGANAQATQNDSGSTSYATITVAATAASSWVVAAGTRAGVAGGVTPTSNATTIASGTSGADAFWSMRLTTPTSGAGNVTIGEQSPAPQTSYWAVAGLEITP